MRQRTRAALGEDEAGLGREQLLRLPYFHVVFSLPGPIADIAYQNKAVVYDLLLKTAAETLITIAADPKHLGARIGLTAVLHTWGSTLTHHPHAHIIVPGGGLSRDGGALDRLPAQLSSPFRSSPGSSVACSSKG
jgi:Putative transposase